jgi:hypothetical protein
VTTIGQLRHEHRGSKVVVAGDRNDMAINLISSLDPTLRQVVRENTNKLKTKVLDVIYTDFQDLMQEATILPQMQVDMGKQGKDSDHYGVEVLPRTNLAPKAGALREKIKVQRFPESKIVDFGFHLVDESWSNLKENMSTTDLVDIFVRTNSNLVDKVFPSKEVLVGPKDLPYFTEELRLLKRQRLRAYTTHGGKSVQYLNLKARFEDKLKSEAMKYVS